jgi:SAM-dependent methyltransferase
MNSAPEVYSSRTFASDPGYVRLFGDFVAEATVRDNLTGPRILEICCGDGVLLMHLLKHIPGSSGTGLDLSLDNIAFARRLAATCTGVPPQFIAGDYLMTQLPVHDLVVSHNALHLLPGEDDRLWGKIAGEVETGGALIISMPYDCLYNRMLELVRRGLRLIRCRPVEAGLFWLSKLLYGRSCSDALLRDRASYNFVVPCRYYTSALAEALREKWQLEQVAEKPEPRLLGKPAHKYIHLRRCRKGGA